MKVLVLGRTGQLGSALVRLLPETGWTWTAIDQPELELTDLDAIPTALARHSFDCLINCTAYNQVDAAQTQRDLAWRINAEAVQCLAAYAAKGGARFVHVSTDYVFDGRQRTPYTEADPVAPCSVYGESKLAGETSAVAHQALVLRTASLFGEATVSRGNFVETMLRVGREKGTLRVVHDITMSPTGAEDLARMLLALLAAKAAPGIYHAVNRGEATWCEFARAIISRAGINADVLPITTAEYPTAATRPAYSVLDTAKLRGVVGDVPHWSDALDRYLAMRRAS